MGYCSVSNCGNCSGKCASKGITFHCFPKDPEVKDKWITATGKRNWFPGRYSRLCSIHFREVDFNPTTKRQTLLKNAYPTIDVWASTEKSTENVQQTSDSKSSSTLSSERPIEQVSNILETLREKKLQRIIQIKESVIKSQRLKIKRLQCKNRRNLEKIKKLQELLKDLEKNKL